MFHPRHDLFLRCSEHSGAVREVDGWLDKGREGVYKRTAPSRGVSRAKNILGQPQDTFPSSAGRRHLSDSSSEHWTEFVTVGQNCKYLN